MPRKSTKAACVAAIHLSEELLFKWELNGDAIVMHSNEATPILHTSFEMHRDIKLDKLMSMDTVKIAGSTVSQIISCDWTDGEMDAWDVDDFLTLELALAISKFADCLMACVYV